LTSRASRLVEVSHPPGPRRPATATYLNYRYADYERPFSYPRTRSAEEWRVWRSRLRRALRRTLRLNRLGRVPIPRSVVLEVAKEDGFERRKIAYETLHDNWVTAYLLIPDRAVPIGASDPSDPRPAVICPHGHVPGGKESVVAAGHQFGAAYGRALVERGVVVLAPDNAGMGERDVSAEPGRGPLEGCYLAWARLNHMGLDLTGLRIFDLMAGLNLLAARDDVDPARLGAAGLSGGCWLSQILAALDSRIAAVVLSGFFTTFGQSVWHGHCVCVHPFGIGALCDMTDISALIAPRPQFVESGDQDLAVPAHPAAAAVRHAYALQGATDRFRFHEYHGGHEFDGTESLPWLVDALTG
jgi:dienelactone hydrolase